MRVLPLRKKKINLCHMRKPLLTTKSLIEAAKDFCESVMWESVPDLWGVTDGKAVGTFVEHEFKTYLSGLYSFAVGSSAKGVDLPSVNCDIKVTSVNQPQSSCPYRDSKQKIYGLGYNLLVFVYQKRDDIILKSANLKFVACVYISENRTADYQTTKGIRDILSRDGNVEDVFAFLVERNIPADEVTLMNMAKSLVAKPPKLGYLTVSNALQWRLQYGRVVALNEKVSGITTIV